MKFNALLCRIALRRGLFINRFISISALHSKAEKWMGMYFKIAKGSLPSKNQNQQTSSAKINAIETSENMKQICFIYISNFNFTSNCSDGLHLAAMRLTDDVVFN